jgi:6-phosphogluconolactonase/glucosamine-6-phosphate isomerase/deaminase
MTYPALKATREIWFLVTGASKAAMIDRLMKRDQTIPSAGIDNPNQHIYWLK